MHESGPGFNHTRPGRGGTFFHCRGQADSVMLRTDIVQTIPGFSPPRLPSSWPVCVLPVRVSRNRGFRGVGRTAVRRGAGGSGFPARSATHRNLTRP